MGKQTMFAFLLMTLVSCKKTTLVTIQAQDYITGTGSAYAGMEYAVAETWTPYLETKSKIVKTGFLDGNGYAFFDLKMKNNRKYILSVAQPDNICYGGLQQHYLEHEKNNTIGFKFSMCGYLKFVLNNVSCFNAFDEVKYSRVWVTGNHNDGENTYIGCDYYEGNFFELPAGEYRYDWEVTKSGITTYHSQNFNIAAGDSMIFQIDY